MELERVEFPEGKQKEFIKYAKKKANMVFSRNEKPFGINYEALQNYYKEYNRISKSNFEKICNFINENPNMILQKFEGKDIFWENIKPLEGFNLKDNTLGLKRIQNKEINITYPQSSILDNSKIIYSKVDIKNRIRFPKIITPELAYEIGTSIGDGCLPSRRNSYRLKGNFKDEIEYYENTIKPLFKKLYNIDINLKKYPKTYGFEYYSKAFIQFKNEVIGLPIGSKRNISVPKILKVNDPLILSALIGGIFDTDGSLYFRSQNKNKNYYPKICITTISNPLAKDLQEILKMLGFNVYLFQDNKVNSRRPSTTYTIVLNGYGNFKKFIELIGTKQKKNLDKIKKWRKEWPKIIG